MSLLDKLPISLPFLNQNKSDGEYFFGLNISSAKVEAAVWGIEGKKLKIINRFETGYDSEADLTDAANFVLDQALQDFQPEPEKILFGVPDNWLQDDNLKPEYLKVLRKMVKDLDLTPMAFVSTTHALTHLMQKQQGAPVTAVLVEVSNPLVVSVVKAGKIIGTKYQKRSDDLPRDIEKALMSFGEVEVLPSKIVVFSTSNEKLEKYENELTSYSWMTQLPFLHLPKIENLKANNVIEAVCLAGASELFPDVVFNPKNIVESNVSHKGVMPLGEDQSNKRAMAPVAAATAALPVAARGRAMTARDDNYEYEVMEKGEEDQMVQQSHHGGNMAHHKKLLGIFGGIGLGGGKHKVMIISVVVIAFLVALYLILPKANVDVFIDMRLLEKEATITVDPTITQFNEAENKVPGQVIEIAVDGSGKGSATGKKQVGESAKGVVTMYNKTSSPKSLSAGTVLIGPNNLQFTLDSSVNIASQSAVEGGISFGKTNVNVTASAIGPEGNLPSGQELSVKDNSTDSVSAKVDTAFSGGVSKDVTVITADDQKRLLAQVASDLKKKASEQLQSKVPSGMKVLEEGLAETITNTSYSKKVGDQAADFNLNLSARYKGTAYSDNDLKKIVSKLVETNVPDGYTLDLTQTETQSAVSKIEKDGRLIFTAKFKAKLMPTFDQNQMKKEIAGKTPAQAAEKLKEIDNVVGSDINLIPPLPGPLARLPFLPQNINLKVTAK